MVESKALEALSIGVEPEPGTRIWSSHEALKWCRRVQHLRERIVVIWTGGMTASFLPPAAIHIFEGKTLQARRERLHAHIELAP